MPGTLNEKTREAVLSALPLDITCVDGDNIIRHYSDYRIFERKPEIPGTRVEECHLPENRAVVGALLCLERRVTGLPGYDGNSRMAGLTATLSFGNIDVIEGEKR